MKAPVPASNKTSIHGFRLSEPIQLSHLRGVAYYATHETSGAQVLKILTDDNENLFSLCFRTPPEDDCGTPHILEYAVLGGSEKFCVKDPFVEMLKSSMATFIDAITYPDRTVYPVSSCMPQDYFNLFEVYCDAVFHPLLRRSTFATIWRSTHLKSPGVRTSIAWSP